MPVKQKTIRQNISFSGVGLHTGATVNVTFKPAAVNEGIRFVRVDLPGTPVIPARPDYVRYDAHVPRCTTIAVGDAAVHTIEHLMGVLCCLGISNLIIEIDSAELPAMDGSGLEYLKLIRQAGTVEQEADAQVFNIREPLGAERNGASIYIAPASDFKVAYTLDYDCPSLRSQFVQMKITEETFEKDIVSSRTFCLEREIAEIRQKGLGKGASSKNALVFGDHGVIDNTLRFPDECARHKILDLIGDLYILGVPILGHVYAVKSGHNLNIDLVKKIHKQRELHVQPGLSPSLDQRGYKVYDVHDIMKVLPHRYPFLLIDRFYEVDPSKTGIGIKNVTINDEFFQGHFPTRPVMPGVLMLEAMAQTGGMIVLTSQPHRGKLAFFMAIDKVKFRRIVVPGDQLVMEVSVIRDRSRTIQVNGVARVNGDVAVEAEMMFSFTDSSFLYG